MRLTEKNSFFLFSPNQTMLFLPDISGGDVSAATVLTYHFGGQDGDLNTFSFC